MADRAEYLEGGNEFAHGILDSDGNFVFITQYAGCTEEVSLASLENQNRAIALFLAAHDMAELLRSIVAHAEDSATAYDPIPFNEYEKARAILQRIEGSN